jgi:class 3 adenylate cyclase
MDFVALVDQVIALLRQRGRVTYRTLQRQFQLDADALADLLGELRYAHPEALHEDEQGLVWTDEARPTPPAPDRPAASGAQVPLTYTPAYLAEQILTSRSALEGERKQVMVLFADIKDSTELIRDLDPEAAQQLLDPALHAMMAAVHRYEGTVNQVLGNGIMALFGAPLAHEDHALRACYAALTMQTAMRAGPTGRRPQSGTTHTTPDRAHRGEPVLSGRERARPGGNWGPGRRGARRLPADAPPAGHGGASDGAGCAGSAHRPAAAARQTAPANRRGHRDGGAFSFVADGGRHGARDPAPQSGPAPGGRIPL